MEIVYQKDSRSGITYAYDNHRVWSEEKGKYVNKRKLIGRVDNVETKEIVLTDGRGKKRSPYLSEAERETLKADESAEFMQNLFTEKNTPVETHERNPDVAGTGNTSSGPQSIVDALEQVRVILEDLRGELSDIKSQMGMGELE